LPEEKRLIANCGSSGTLALLGWDGVMGMKLNLVNLRTGKNSLFKLTAKPEVGPDDIPNELGSGLETMELICNEDSTKLVVAVRSHIDLTYIITYLFADIKKRQFFTLGTFNSPVRYFGGRWMNPRFSSIFVGDANTDLYKAASLTPLSTNIIEPKSSKHQNAYFENHALNIIQHGDGSLSDGKSLQKSTLISMTKYSEVGSEAQSRCVIKTSKIVHMQPAISGVLLTVSNPNNPKLFQPVFVYPNKERTACELRSIGHWQVSPFVGEDHYVVNDAYADIGVGVIRASHPQRAFFGEQITTEFSLLKQNANEQPLFSFKHEFKGIHEETGLSWGVLDMPSESEATFVHSASATSDGWIVHFWK
jgi:hypothetical protein